MPKSAKFSSDPISKVDTHGQYTQTSSAGYTTWNLDPASCGDPIAAMGEIFMFYRFKKVRMRLVKVTLDGTAAEATRYFSFGMFQAVNSVGNPTIATSENNIRNVQYGRVYSALPGGAESNLFSNYWEWLEPELPVGPYAGWFRTVGGSDDEDGDSQGKFYICSDITTGNTTAFVVEYEMQAEFKELVEGTITPQSLVNKFPSFRKDPSNRSPDAPVICRDRSNLRSLLHPAHQMALAKIMWKKSDSKLSDWVEPSDQSSSSSAVVLSSKIPHDITVKEMVKDLEHSLKQMPTKGLGKRARPL